MTECVNKYATKLLGDKPAKRVDRRTDSERRYQGIRCEKKEYFIKPKHYIFFSLGKIFGFTIIHHQVIRQVQYKEKSARLDGVCLLKRVKENISGIQNNKKNSVQLCEKLI